MKSTCAMIVNEERMGSFPPPAAQVILRFVCLGILTKRHQFQPLIGFVKTSAQGPELKSVLPTCRLHRERSWAFWIFTCKKKKKISLYKSIYISNRGRKSSIWTSQHTLTQSWALLCYCYFKYRPLFPTVSLSQMLKHKNSVFIVLLFYIFVFIHLLI